MAASTRTHLQLLPCSTYVALPERDPMRFYFWPVIGKLYRRRVELCLAECVGGQRVLEIGFGSGVTFLNLHEMYDEIHGLDLTAPAETVAQRFAQKGIAVQLCNGNVLNMPYPDGYFDTVLLISILEHLRPEELGPAFQEIGRVLKPGGQVVYGVPVERPLMVLMFRLLGYNIRDHHFSTETDVAHAAGATLEKVRLIAMHSISSIFGQIYEVGHFRKAS